MKRYRITYTAYCRLRTTIIDSKGYPCSTFGEEIKAQNKEEAEYKFKKKYEDTNSIDKILNIKEILSK